MGGDVTELDLQMWEAGTGVFTAPCAPVLTLFLPTESHLFWIDLASQPLWPTICVMFLASHQALLSGNRASLLMGGGAASNVTGRTAPTRTQSIVPVTSRALELSTGGR